MRAVKIKNATHLLCQVLHCDEDEVERRLNASVPSDDDLDAWLSRLKEGAFQTAMLRNRLTEAFLQSIHLFDGEERLDLPEFVEPRRG